MSGIHCSIISNGKILETTLGVYLSFTIHVYISVQWIPGSGCVGHKICTFRTMLDKCQIDFLKKCYKLYSCHIVWKHSFLTFSLSFFFFLAALCHLLGLSSQTRNWTQVPTVKAPSSITGPPRNSPIFLSILYMSVLQTIISWQKKMVSLFIYLLISINFIYFLTRLDFPGG